MVRGASTRAAALIRHAALTRRALRNALRAIDASKGRGAYARVVLRNADSFPAAEVLGRAIVDDAIAAAVDRVALSIDERSSGQERAAWNRRAWTDLPQRVRLIHAASWSAVEPASVLSNTVGALVAGRRRSEVWRAWRNAVGTRALAERLIPRFPHSTGMHVHLHHVAHWNDADQAERKRRASAALDDRGGARNCGEREIAHTAVGQSADRVRAVACGWIEHRVRANTEARVDEVVVALLAHSEVELCRGRDTVGFEDLSVFCHLSVEASTTEQARRIVGHCIAQIAFVERVAVIALGRDPVLVVHNQRCTAANGPARAVEDDRVRDNIEAVRR